MRRAILGLSIALIATTGGCQCVLGLGDYVVDDGSGAGGTTGTTATGGTAGTGGTASSAGGTTAGGGTGGSACMQGEMKSCYSGPPGTDGVAHCKAGTQTCKQDGTGFEPCQGEMLPKPEIYHNDEDEDCDGVANAKALFSFLWGDAQNQTVLDAASDGQGNLVVFGTNGGQVVFTTALMAESASDPFIVKFDSTGAPLWSYDYGGGVNGDGKLAVAANGDIAIGGTFAGPLTFGGNMISGPAMYVARANQDGTGIWGRKIDCTGLLRPYGIGFGKDDVVVTGEFNCDLDLGDGSFSPKGGSDGFVGAFADPAGNTKWSNGLGGAVGNDKGNATAALGAELAAVIGTFLGTADVGGTMVSADMDGVADLFVMTVDSNGGAMSVKAFGGGHYRQDLTSDADGNLIVAGWFSGATNFGGQALAGGAGSVFVAKLSSSLEHIWSVRFGGAAFEPGGGIVTASIALATDSKRNVLLSVVGKGTVDFGGGTLGVADEEGEFLVKLDENGDHVWSKRFDGIGSKPCPLGVGPNDEVLMACEVQAPMIDFGSGPLSGKGGSDVVVAGFAP